MFLCQWLRWTRWSRLVPCIGRLARVLWPNRHEWQVMECLQICSRLFSMQVFLFQNIGGIIHIGRWTPNILNGLPRSMLSKRPKQVQSLSMNCFVAEAKLKSQGRRWGMMMLSQNATWRNFSTRAMMVFQKPTLAQMPRAPRFSGQGTLNEYFWSHVGNRWPCSWGARSMCITGPQRTVLAFKAWSGWASSTCLSLKWNPTCNCFLVVQKLWMSPLLHARTGLIR